MARAVGGLLVFAHPRCQLEVAASPVPIARPERVLDILRDCQAQLVLSEAEQVHLVELIVAVQPPGLPAALGSSGWRAACAERGPGTRVDGG